MLHRGVGQVELPHQRTHKAYRETKMSDPYKEHPTIIYRSNYYISVTVGASIAEFGKKHKSASQKCWSHCWVSGLQGAQVGSFTTILNISSKAAACRKLSRTLGDGNVREEYLGHDSLISP